MEPGLAESKAEMDSSKQEGLRDRNDDPGMNRSKAKGEESTRTRDKADIGKPLCEEACSSSGASGLRKSSTGSTSSGLEELCSNNSGSVCTASGTDRGKSSLATPTANGGNSG